MAGGCAAGILAASRGFAAPEALPTPIGYSTVGWPEAEFEHALETISSLGFAGVQLVGWARERYVNRVEALRQRLQDLHLKAVAQSCWGVELDPGNPVGDTATFRAYAEFAQRLGGSILQVTDNGRPDGEYSAASIRRLGEEINELGRVAQGYGLTLGYHPHVGSFGETEEGATHILGATDPYLVKLIADTGHLTLGGMDPAEIVRTYRDRLTLVHLKDVRKDAAEAARVSRAALRDHKYLFCEVGHGIVDFTAFDKALREVQYRGWIMGELDSNEPAPGGSDEGARVNRDALRKLGWVGS